MGSEERLRIAIVSNIDMEYEFEDGNTMLAIYVDHYEIDNGTSGLWAHEKLTKISEKQPKRQRTYHIWTCALR